MSDSLYNPMTTLGKAAKPLQHPYKGKVVQVGEDFERTGKIKVSIPELYGDYKEGCEGTLPWIYPRYYGKFNNLVSLDVPELGEIVEVEFPYKNIYLGYYTNKPVFKNIWDKIAEIDEELGMQLVQIFTGEHYPNVYGSFDKNLTGWYVDKVTDEIFLVQGTTKASIKLEGGTLKVNCPKNIEFNAGEEIILNAGVKYSMHAPDAQITVDNTLTSSITTTNNTGDINNTGNITNSGTATIQGGVTGNGVVLETHTHKVPQSPSGVNESEAPTK